MLTAHTLKVKPHVHTTHSQGILFTNHTYLIFAFSLINAESRNAAVPCIDQVIYQILPLPFLTPPTRKGLGTKLGHNRLTNSVLSLAEIMIFAVDVVLWYSFLPKE